MDWRKEFGECMSRKLKGKMKGKPLHVRQQMFKDASAECRKHRPSGRSVDEKGKIIRQL